MTTNERKWTDSQRTAIDHIGKNLILSAAAGSGKTDTLTERIIRIVHEGGDLSRILAVTFTNAAADELRERIGDALNRMLLENPADPHAAHSLAILDCARISTIHSFFKTETEPYAARFGLPPSFGIIEESEGLLLRRDAMSETLNAFFDEPTDDFEYLCECISGAKNEKGLDEALLNIRDSLISQRVSLSDAIYTDGDFMLSPAAIPVKKEMREAAEHFGTLFRIFADRFRKTTPGGKAELEALRLAEIAGRLEGAADKELAAASAFFALACEPFPRLSTKESERMTDGFDYFKDRRDKFRKLLGKMNEEFFSLTAEEYAEADKRYTRVFKALAAVLESFEGRYSAAKRERGCVDYNDLETMADRLFCAPDGSPTREALDAGSKFDHILIDEYQDTSLIQDRVFAAISASVGRFMVGDVKQSIYGFRGARPELFNRYREQYLKGDGGDAIFLSENFRSDKNVIDFSNMVSEHIFTCGAAPFSEEDHLICSKDGGRDNESPCDIVFLRTADKTDDGEIKFDDYEPDYVAERILAILEGREDVGLDSVTPSDIAVLIRSGTKADAISKALIRRGVPVNNGAEEKVFSYGEVLLVLCLLNCADNPMRDIYLAGALKSHVFGFTLEELIRVRGKDRVPLWYSLREYAKGTGDLADKCRRTVDAIDRWRRRSSETDAQEILRLILSDTGMIRYGGDSERTPEDVTRSLKLLLSHAATVAGNGGNLHDLTVYFEGLVEKEDKTPFKKVPGCVSILTIHKSKGLGFPVCFVCTASKQFNLMSTRDNVLLTSDGSLTMKLCDDSGLVKYKTPHYCAAVRDAVRKSVEEEARVLYVAMTRAKNKLVITVPADDPQKMLETARERSGYPLTPYEVAAEHSYAAWIVDAAVRNTPSRVFSMHTVMPDEVGCGRYEEKVSGEAADTGFYEFLEGTERGNYEREYLISIPAKLTVSALKPDILNTLTEESDTFDRRSVSVMPPEAPLPRFLRDDDRRTAADAGTATHIFMQFCDLQNLRDRGAASELERLIAAQFISEEDA